MNLNKNLLIVIILIILLFGMAKLLARRAAAPVENNKATTSGSTSSNDQMCAQVITNAKNSHTGEIKEFPNACLPAGWESLGPVAR